MKNISECTGRRWVCRKLPLTMFPLMSALKMGFWVFDPMVSLEIAMFRLGNRMALVSEHTLITSKYACTSKKVRFTMVGMNKCAKKIHSIIIFDLNFSRNFRTGNFHFQHVSKCIHVWLYSALPPNWPRKFVCFFSLVRFVYSYWRHVFTSSRLHQLAILNFMRLLFFSSPYT